MSVLVRLLGLALLPLSPAMAAWALFVFRKSDVPEDHSYLCNLRELVAESWTMITKGNVFG